MKKYTIFMWEPNLSPHKLGLYRALRAHPCVDRVVYVTQEGVPEERQKLGWTVNIKEDDEIVYGPDEAQSYQIVEMAPLDAVHIFSGMRRVPCIVYGLKAALRLKRAFGLMSEPRAAEGWAGLARVAHSWLTEGQLRRKAGFVLAIGKNGPPWFLRVGYTHSRIFPFAYFLPPPVPRHPLSARPTPPLVVYLGRLEEGKGLQIWLESRKKTKVPARYIIAGSGTLAPLVEKHRTAPGPPIDVLGPLPISKAAELLADADVVCAPSISKDGWCAVVSEALMAGAAVITTPQVGASVCVERDQRLGSVVMAQATHVAAAIDELLSGDALSPDVRAWRQAWAIDRLSSEAGAKSLLSIFFHLYENGNRPEPFYA